MNCGREPANTYTSLGDKSHGITIPAHRSVVFNNTQDICVRRCSRVPFCSTQLLFLTFFRSNSCVTSYAADAISKTAGGRPCPTVT